MLLATDLDGTFLGGTSAQKEQLYSLIRQHREICLVFVTGRGLGSVKPLLIDPAIPNPDFIICDVGATILNGKTLEPVEPLQSAIEQKWPGSPAIVEALSSFSELVYQEVPQERRCSFFAKDEKIIPGVAALVASLHCEVIYSAGKFLDILPAGVNKGTSLSKLVTYLDYPPADVLVAGDTLNDLAMFQCGYRSVAVGRSEDRLLLATADLENTYHAEAPGAGGILEAINEIKTRKLNFAQPR